MDPKRMTRAAWDLLLLLALLPAADADAEAGVEEAADAAVVAVVAAIARVAASASA